MPSPWVKKLSRELGKSEREIESLWIRAKKITSEEFGVSDENFTDKHYSYTVGIVKKMLGMDEAIMDPVLFLKSEKTAKEYLESVMVSSNFSIGNLVTRDKKKDSDIVIKDENEEPLEFETREESVEKEVSQEVSQIDETNKSLTAEEVKELFLKNGSSNGEEVDPDLISQFDKIIEEKE